MFRLFPVKKCLKILGQVLILVVSSALPFPFLDLGKHILLKILLENFNDLE